jgi:hypothetical protein
LDGHWDEKMVDHLVEQWDDYLDECLAGWSVEYLVWKWVVYSVGHSEFSWTDQWVYLMADQ